MTLTANQEYYRKNKTKMKARVKLWREKNPARHRANHLRLAYNITIEQYDAILLAQNGVCGVCGRPPGSRRLAVDHDHLSKEVRGLLCFRCNKQIIGRHHNTILFYAAINYLNNPPARAVLALKETA